ncbi:MAG: NBR1-Ig-like domain-containing protein [Pelolinea sp.]|nr:NBR1-Ig-like domain-containing protein [Pelolinea sp.]
MQKNFKRILLGAALVAVLLITACGTGEPQEPTPDINAIRTEAIQTAMVEMTVQAALSPSETAPPPTLTPLPTATLSTDAAQPAAGSASSASSGSSSGGSSGTAIPTSTPDPYKCKYISEDPLDGPQPTGANYDKYWTFQNVGTATWTAKDYYIKWVSGPDLSYKHIYKIPHDVAPYQTVTFGIDVVIPTNPISEGIAYVDYWQLISDNGDVVCNFQNTITRTYPPLPTPTP